MASFENARAIEALTATLNNIGALLLNMGRHKEAMEHLQEATNLRVRSLKLKIDQKEESYEEEAVKVRFREAIQKEEQLRAKYECWNNNDEVRFKSVLDVYESSELEESSFCFSDALRIDKESCLDQQMDAAITLYNLGLIHHRLGYYDKAMQLFGVALCTVSTDYPAVAVTVLNNTAQIQYRQGLYDKAMQSFSKAFRIEEQALQMHASTGDYHLTEYLKQAMVITLSGLGRIYFRYGLYEDAMEMCRHNLQLQRQMFGNHHLYVAVTKYNIGLIYRQKGQFHQAIKNCQYFVQQASTVLGIQHHHILAALQTIGSMQSTIGSHYDAKITLSTCLQARRSTLGNNHYLVADTLFQLGAIYESEAQYDRAFDHYDEALAINATLYGNDHGEVAKVLYNIAHIHRIKGDLRKALLVYNEVLRISRILFGEIDDFVLGLHVIIGSIHVEVAVRRAPIDLVSAPAA